MIGALRWAAAQMVEWALCALGAHVPPEYARRPECLGWACQRCGEWRVVDLE